MDRCLRRLARSTPDQSVESDFPAKGQPTSDQIFAKHLVAVGGAERLRTITSMVGRGRHIGFDDAEKALSSVRVGFSTEIGDREVNVVQGTTSSSSTRCRLTWRSRRRGLRRLPHFADDISF